MRNSELTVNVPVADLLEALKRNRETHREEFDLAMTGFIIELRSELESKLASLEGGHAVELRFRSQKPEMYFEEYTDVIEMLEFGTDSDVEITREQFKCWVQNQWHWRGSWVASNSGYITTAQLGASR